MLAIALPRVIIKGDCGRAKGKRKGLVGELETMVIYSKSRRKTSFQFINKHHKNCPVVSLKKL